MDEKNMELDSLLLDNGKELNEKEQKIIKSEELLKLAKEKGTPILENVAKEVKEKTVVVIKEVLSKLENEEPKKAKNNKESK